MLRRLGPLPAVLAVLGVCAAAGCAKTASAATPPVGYEAVLTARAHAVLAHDTARIEATTASSAPPSTRELGARTSVLPLTAWDYHVQAVAPGPARGEIALTAQLDYRLRGDRADVANSRRILLARSGSAWRVLADDPLGPALPWDLGPVAVGRGASSLVLAPPATGSGSAASLAADADRAVAAVRELWGSGWSDDAVIVAVADSSDLARVLGRAHAGVDGLVAVSTADRVYVDLPAYATLSQVGRQVLLTHEITHLATGSSSDRATPQWLKEGFADYVGLLHSGLGTATAAAFLATVRHVGAPASLPPDAAFDPAAAPSSRGGYALGDAYAAAWLACRLIADRAGTAGLVRVYRAAAAGRGTPAADADAALRQVTGWSPAQWTTIWRAQVSQIARTAPVAR